MKLSFFRQSVPVQFIISASSVILVAMLSYAGVNYMGYRAVALLLLATVSVLSMFFTLYPVLTAATLSALIWDFFFIPPHFTLHVDNSEDALLLMMYFIVAMVNGVLNSKVRELEKLEFQKEERNNTLKLYKTLFNSISHELRTPIATIVGATDNLQQKNRNISEADKDKLIDEISIATFRLNRLIDNLLNMQRLESGMLKINPDWCDVNELINSPLNRLQAELSTHTVKLNIQEEIPVLKFDFGLIEQALFNILHNETLYTPTDSVIEISATYNKKTLKISIADNGKEFSEEELQLLFSKFYRSSVKTGGGTGLGLSIVKGFVEAHRGKVSVENNVPNGAKFTIEIPTEALELNDFMDFSEIAIKKNADHETLSDQYIPRAKKEKTEEN